MKEMYIIEKELHTIKMAPVPLRRADLYDAENGEWIGRVADKPWDAKPVFWYRGGNGKVRFIVEMKEDEEIAVYDVAAKHIAMAILRKSSKLLAALAGWLIAEAAGGVIENVVGSLLGF